MYEISRLEYATIRITYSNYEQLSNALNALNAFKIVHIESCTPDETTTDKVVEVFYEYFKK